MQGGLLASAPMPPLTAFFIKVRAYASPVLNQQGVYAPYAQRLHTPMYNR